MVIVLGIKLDITFLTENTNWKIFVLMLIVLSIKLDIIFLLEMEIRFRNCLVNENINKNYLANEIRNSNYLANYKWNLIRGANLIEIIAKYPQHSASPITCGRERYGIL